MDDLRKEAALSTMLKSPHVVQVHEIIEDPAYYYIVMDFLGQTSVLDLLATETTLPEI